MVRPVKKWYLYFFYFILCCSCKQAPETTIDHAPQGDYDVGYIPFDPAIDHSSFKLCHSDHSIYSGRNSIRYVKGNMHLFGDLSDSFSDHSSFDNYSGYVVIRFLMNCKGETGRYRLECLNYDFTATIAPEPLKDHIAKHITAIRWIHKDPLHYEKDYSKFLNLKFENGILKDVHI